VIENGNKIQLADSLPYFLNSIDRIKDHEYSPNETDHLKVKIKTTGIVPSIMNLREREFVLVDTGGQSNERRKWPLTYQANSAVIFTTPLNSHSLLLYEDSDKNRLDDSIRLFNKIVNEPALKDVPFILILTKSDRLETALKQEPLKNVCPDYDGGDDVSKATAFIKNLHLKQYTGDNPNKITTIVCSLTTMSKTEVENIINTIVDVALKK